MDMFWLNHEQLLKGVNLGFQRYLSRQVKWDVAVQIIPLLS